MRNILSITCKIRVSIVYLSAILLVQASLAHSADPEPTLYDLHNKDANNSSTHNKDIVDISDKTEIPSEGNNDNDGIDAGIVGSGEGFLDYAASVGNGEGSLDYAEPVRVCTLCSPGYGVETQCTDTVDTSCIVCKVEYYQAEFTKDKTCTKCIECGAGEFIETSCTPIQDTVCGSCTGNGGYGNEDFVARCPEENLKRIEQLYAWDEGSGEPLLKFEKEPNEVDPWVLEMSTEPGVAAAEGGDAVMEEGSGDEGSAVFAVFLPDEETGDDNDIVPMVAAVPGGDPHVGASSDNQQGGVPVFGVVITAIVCALVFFVAGFLLKKYGTKKGWFRETKDIEAPHVDPEKAANTYVANGETPTPPGSLPNNQNHVEDEIQPLLKPARPHDHVTDMDLVAGDHFQEDAGGGNNQSPVNIQCDSAVYESTLPTKPLQFRYVEDKALHITNTGHCLQVSMDTEPPNSCIEGGPLAGKFQLEELRFHLGSRDDHGSEHHVDGQQYPAELHLVHWNRDNFTDFSEAVELEEGVCIIAVLLNVGKAHEDVQNLIDHVEDVRYKDEHKNIDMAFNPQCLLPKDTEKYWTYSGSLTTPPYNETVTWVVMKEPIEISKEQLGKFRSLMKYGRNEGHLLNTYRQPQPLSGRTVFASFQANQ